MKLKNYIAYGVFAGMAILALFICVIFLSGQPRKAEAADCTVTNLLVNPCRPWVGATAGGYAQVGSDLNTQLTFFNKRLNDASVLNNASKSVTINNKMDIAHVYHSQGSNLFSGSAQAVLNNSAFPMVFVNWKPLPSGYKWKDAAGGNTTVDNYIKTGANSVKALGSRKIFLTIWHEPENDVSSGNCTANASGASMGSPSEYVAMWKNVRKIFDQQGVANVVWAMNYMGYSKWDCLVPKLWPGNSYVDWVVYDTYATGGESFQSSISRFYNFLASNSNSTYNYGSKPWGLAEHGYNNPSGTGTEANASKYWTDGKSAIEANTYPNIKMWLVFDTSTNGTSQVGYTFGNQVSTGEQTAFNSFATAILSKQSSSGSGGGGGTGGAPPTPTTPPPATTPPPSGEQAGAQSGTVVSTTGETVTVAQENATISGDAVLTPELATDTAVQAEVDFVEYFANGALTQTVADPPFQFDTRKLANGPYEITEKVHYKDGQVKETTTSVTIKNAATVQPAKRISPVIWVSGGAAVVVFIGGFLFRHQIAQLLGRMRRGGKPPTTPYDPDIFVGRGY